MAIIVSAQPTGSYDPIPEGNFTAGCVSIVDLGTQQVMWKGQVKLQRKGMFTWEIPEITFDYEGEQRPKVISREYTLTLDERGNLRSDLESWRGKRFTEDELAAFDLANVLGTYCTLQILHTRKGDRTYANISSIISLPKGADKPKLFNEPIYFDLTTDDCLTVMDKLPGWIQDKIKKSPEYLNLIEAQVAEPLTDFAPIDDDGDLPF